MSWFDKALKRSHRTAATDDGGLSICGPLYPGQSQIFKKKKKNVIHQKKQRNPGRRPGEQESGSM